MAYKIFTLSPGSTSTKLAVFDGEELVFKANVTHDPEKLKTFARVNEQLPYRVETIMDELKKAGIDLVKSNIESSKQEWDSYEISWNFKVHPLIRKTFLITEAFK